MKVSRILMVEDDPAVVELVRQSLEGDITAAIDAAPSGEEGLQRAESCAYDLIILDINLPGMNGIQVCRSLRDADKRVPIIMLTSKTDELDKVLGLELGADDYITKPFSPRELAARIRAVLRRTLFRESAPSEGQLRFGALRIDPAARIVSLGQAPLKISTTEFDILYLLAANAGRVIPRDQILQAIFGSSSVDDEAALTTYICRIRAKLAADELGSRFIQTVRGLGYRFTPPESP